MCSVFATYNTEGEGTTDQIFSCVQYLKQNGIKVYLDSTENKIRGTSICDWIDTKLEECKLVIMFINEHYLAQIKNEENLEDIEDIAEYQHQLHTTYIYRRLHRQYIESHSFNYTVLPVILKGCQLKHIPDWLKDTVFYQWPKNRHALVNRIKMNNSSWPELGELESLSLV